MEDFVKINDNDFSNLKLMLRNEMCSTTDSLFIEQGIIKKIPYIISGDFVAVDINVTKSEHSDLLFNHICDQTYVYSDDRIANYKVYIKKYANMDVELSKQYNYDILTECLFYNGVSSENIIAILSDIMGGLKESSNDDFIIYDVYSENVFTSSLQNEILNYPYRICDDNFYQNNRYNNYNIYIKNINSYGEKYDDMLDFLHKNW